MLFLMLFPLFGISINHLYINHQAIKLVIKFISFMMLFLFHPILFTLILSLIPHPLNCFLHSLCYIILNSIPKVNKLTLELLPPVGCLIVLYRKYSEWEIYFHFGNQTGRGYSIPEGDDKSVSIATARRKRRRQPLKQRPQITEERNSGRMLYVEQVHRRG